MKRPIFLAAVFGLLLTGVAARAEDGPPEMDIEKTCSSPGRAEVQVQANDQDSRDGCLRSEREAHDQLKRRWSEFTPEAKSQCSKQSRAGGYPSYVETVTCLELATGAVPAPTNEGGTTATKGPGAPNAARTGKSDLTAEPSARQRTNPIDVLEKKP